MSASPRTTTSPREKPPLFEPPEIVLDEMIISASIALPINAENFSRLIATNFLVAMCARDRKLERQFFEDVLVTAFNFQNRLIRIGMINTMLENLEEGKGFGTTDMKEELGRHMKSAADHQHKLSQCLKLFGEMRSAEDPVQ
jgi:hypothetical protein